MCCISFNILVKVNQFRCRYNSSFLLYSFSFLLSQEGIAQPETCLRIHGLRRRQRNKKEEEKNKEKRRVTRIKSRHHKTRHAYSNCNIMNIFCSKTLNSYILYPCRKRVYKRMYRYRVKVQSL